MWDGAVTGLGLRCLRRRREDWVYRYRAAGGGANDPPHRSLRLGSWPEVSVEAARKAARAQAGAVAHGRDPAAERREEQAARKATLRVALDDYERSLRQRRLVNVRPTMSALRRGLSRLMANDVRTLTRADYVAAVAVIERDGRMGAAGDLRKHCRTFAEWCVGRGLADYNPLAGLRRPRRTRAERLEADRAGPGAVRWRGPEVWQAAESLGSFGGWFGSRCSPACGAANSPACAGATSKPTASCLRRSTPRPAPPTRCR